MESSESQIRAMNWSGVLKESLLLWCMCDTKDSFTLEDTNSTVESTFRDRFRVLFFCFLWVTFKFFQFLTKNTKKNKKKNLKLKTILKKKKKKSKYIFLNSKKKTKKI